MSWLEKYQTSRYVEFGRVLPDVDCWGLVRLARAEMGWPLLPAFGHASYREPRGITLFCQQQSAEMVECPAEVGAIAAVFRGRLCTHVGLVVEVDGKLGVLDTNPRTGCHWQPVRNFEASHPKVTYYRD